MFTSSFKGGIHPPEKKKQTEHKSIQNISIPHECCIPMQQHIGKPAVPVVDVGDFVQVGQLIARSDGFVSSNIHASIPGKITSIDKYPTPSNEEGLCIVIKTHGQFSFESTTKKNEWNSFTQTELKDLVSQAGIVGMGGAAFPTHVKLSPPENKPVDTLIINAAECEPYLTVDDAMMKEYCEEVITGTEITLKILGISNAIIGIENNKHEAFKKLKTVLKETNTTTNIEVKKMPTKYPQGAEKQLIYTLTKREVPSGGLPMDIGVVVQNIGTIFAIYQAVCEEKPLYERLVTVSGSLVKKPGNYKVKIGTKLSHLVEECGGLTGEPAKIVLGGPMCGNTVNDLDIPIVKGTSGVLFLSKKETVLTDYEACIRCGRCVSVCPIRLLPYDIANASELGKYDIAENMHPLDCIQCGACSYVCPSGRPISHFIKVSQEYIRSNMRK